MPPCQRRVCPGFHAISIVMALAFIGMPARGEEKTPEHSAVKPVARLGPALVRHEALVVLAKLGNIEVLFLGDSITRGWTLQGLPTWKVHFEPLKAGNFGINGDRTEHVLWRLTLGKGLNGIQPRATVLMIGTNNLKTNTNEEIVDGNAAIVKELRRQQPEMKILLLGIFPRGAKPSDPLRKRIKEINGGLAKLADGKQVRFLDIGDKFLDMDGNLPREIMLDYLHPTWKGYEIWADAIKGPLDEMLKK